MNASPLNNGKLKCLAKVILFYVLFIVLLAGFSFFKSLFTEKYERLAFGILGTAAGLLIILIFLKAEKKTFRDAGLFFQRSTLLKFLAGAAAGILIMGTVTLLVVFFSGLKIESNPKGSLLAFLLATTPLIPLAFMEELPTRGYALTALRENFGIRSSVLITAVLFACLHIFYGWSVQSSILGPGIMGILFAVGALYSGGIALPTGMHYAFNLTTSAFAVTGQSFNLWILKNANGQSLENYQQPLPATLLPQVFLLAGGLLLLELYARRYNNSSR